MTSLLKLKINCNKIKQKGWFVQQITYLCVLLASVQNCLNTVSSSEIIIFQSDINLCINCQYNHCWFSDIDINSPTHQHIYLRECSEALVLFMSSRTDWVSRQVPNWSFVIACFIVDMKWIIIANPWSADITNLRNTVVHNHHNHSYNTVSFITAC